jgi:translation initiation factor IF-3
VVETQKARQMAEERGFDLVEVDPTKRPSVCKIMDYGKYLYKIAKQERLHRAHQKKVETKGVRFTLRTFSHDLSFKAKQAYKFLKEGHKVKIEIVLKGRERAHRDLAQEKIKEFLEIVSNFNKEEGEKLEIVTEQEAKKSPLGITIVIAGKSK